MESFNKFSALWLIGTAVLVISTQLCSAQNQPEDYVKVHNEIRAEVGAGPVKWSRKIASYAKKYANKRARDCEMEHSYGPYAENIAQGDVSMTGDAAVRYWATEKADYDLSTKTCSKGADECGHYVNIVAVETTEIGCARVKCSNGGYFVICDYEVPGVE